VVLPDPCKPAMRMTEGGCEANFNLTVSRPSNSMSSSRTIFTTCSAGERAGHDLLANRLLANVVDQFLDDLEVDIGLKQRQADFTQGFGDVLLAQFALAAEILECTLQFCR